MKKFNILLFALIIAINVFSQTTKETEDYFNIFLNKQGNDLIEVFTMHQPTLMDCKVMFKKNYYKEAFKEINETFVHLSEQTEIQNNRFKNKSACRATEFISSDVSKCPGAVKKISDKYNPNIKFFKIEFLETKNTKHGSSYYFFTLINNRWVYFPMN